MLELITAPERARVSSSVASSNVAASVFSLLINVRIHIICVYYYVVVLRDIYHIMYDTYYVTKYFFRATNKTLHYPGSHTEIGEISRCKILIK